MSIDPKLTGPLHSTLWSRFHNPRVLDFYASLHEKGASSAENWQPMVELILRIRSMASSVRLFAFISRQQLYITTATGYVDSSGHDVISIGWDPWQQRFLIGYGSLDHDLGAHPAQQAQIGPEGVGEALAPWLARLMTAA